MMNTLERPTKLKFTAAMLSLVLLATAGCGADDIEADETDGEAETGTYTIEDGPYTRNVEVYDHVKRLDDRAAEVVDIEEERLHFPSAVADELDKYESGDVMATSYGSGLLRRVESIEEDAERIVVETSPASLADVLADGEIYVAAHAEPDVEAPKSFQELPDAPEGSTAKQGLSLDAGWDDTFYDWDRDFASDLNSRIPAGVSDYFKVDQASLGVDLGGEFYVDAGTSGFSVDLNSIRAGANGTANATLGVSVESTDEFDYSDTFYLASTDASNDPMVELDRQEADVAGLVKLTFDADSKLELDASVDGEVSASGEVQLNGNLRGGIEKKEDSWQTYTDAGFSPSGEGPMYEGEKNFEASAKLQTTLDVGVSDTATGSLTVEPATATVDMSQQIDSESGACPTYFNVNVYGKASGQLEKLSAFGMDFDIMDSPSSWTMYDEDFLTYEEQLDLPDICDPDYEPPEFGDGGRSAEMQCRDDSDCDSGVTCFRDTCVTEGPLRVSVAWFEDTDVDLQVTTPSGKVVDWESFASGNDVDGLYYDFPTCTDGCTGNPPYVENIFSDGTPPSGTYTVEVVHFEERNSAAGSDFALAIAQGDDVRNEGGTLPKDGDSVAFEFEVD
ncbi:MAG: hypothetical protein ACOCV2_00830 [Persicimonas sp.]